MDLSQKILSDIGIFMKYAKYQPELKRRETWDEICDRYHKMMSKKYPNLKKDISENMVLIRDKKILMSMRSAQFAGKPIEISPSRLFNCAFLHISDLRAFGEVMFLLLGGSGVGYSVQKKHITELPEIQKPLKARRYLVGDSIEGWSQAVDTLVKSYFGLNKARPEFDFRDIRPKGARLITSGGKAPGHVPLETCLFKIKQVLESKNNGEKLSSLDCHKINCYIADAVLSGGIRRAALSCLFDFDDNEMLYCKSGNWWELNPEFARANNSAVILRHKIKKSEWDKFWSIVKSNKTGEPGFVFSNNSDWGFNPCFTGDTLVAVADGRNAVSIKQLAEENWTGPIYTIQNGQVIVGHCSKVWKTRKNSDLIKVTLDDGSSIRCTPDHKFMLRNGNFVEAKNLIENTSLMPFNSNERRIISIEYLEEKEDVYDLTVDVTHNFAVISNKKDSEGIESSGVFVHNCFEISLKDKEFCNLTTINVSNIESEEDFYNRCRAASFFGTLQAGFTDFHYLREGWQVTTEKEALIGVSQTGVASFDYSDEILQNGSKIVTDTNEHVAGLIGINKSNRCTTIKPEGTSSIVLGCSSGVHAWDNEYYIRRIRVGKNESIYSYLKNALPELVEDDVFKPDIQAVISIPQKAPQGSILKEQENALSLLERAKSYQVNWIRPGHRKGDNYNNVSITVNLKDDEWDTVGQWIWVNKEYFSAISVLPEDLGTYVQAPFEKITKEKYEEMFSLLKDIDLSNVMEEEDETSLKEELACAGNNCQLI